MTKRIIGAFKTSEEALETIDALEAEGYLTKDLQIFTTNKDSDSLRGSTEVYVESGEAESEKEAKQSLIDKVKSAVPFLDEPEEPSLVQKKLVEIGVPQEEVVKYAPAGDTGTIFIIAEEDPDGSAAGGTSKKKLVVKEDAAAGNLSANSGLDEIEERQDIDLEPENSTGSTLTEPDREVMKAESTEDQETPVLGNTNPPIEEQGKIPAEQERPAGERDNEKPITPNPAVGGIGAVQGNSDADIVRDKGTPHDHQHTPLDKTESDMEKREQDRQRTDKHKK